MTHFEVPTESKKLVSINSTAEVAFVESRKVHCKHSESSCSTKSGTPEEEVPEKSLSVLSARDLTATHEELLWKSVKKVIRVFDAFAHVKNVTGICSLSGADSTKIFVEDGSGRNNRMRKCLNKRPSCYSSSKSNLSKYWSYVLKDLDLDNTKLRTVILPEEKIDNAVFAVADVDLKAAAKTSFTSIQREFKVEALFVLELKEVAGKKKMTGSVARRGSAVIELDDLHWDISECYFIPSLDAQNKDPEIEKRLGEYRTAKLAATTQTLELPRSMSGSSPKGFRGTTSSVSSSCMSTPSWTNMSPKYTPVNPISLTAMYGDWEAQRLCRRANIEFPASTLLMKTHPGMANLSPLVDGCVAVRGKLGGDCAFTEKPMWSASTAELYRDFMPAKEWYTPTEFLRKFENGICLAHLSSVDNPDTPAVAVLVVAGPNPTRTHVCSDPNQKYVTNQIRLFDLFEPAPTPTEYNSNTRTIAEFSDCDEVEIRLFKYMRPEAEFTDSIYLTALIMNDLKIACKLLKKYTDIICNEKELSDKEQLPHFINRSTTGPKVTKVY